jgi:phytoene dehydrogenase-like protein
VVASDDPPRTDVIKPGDARKIPKPLRAAALSTRHVYDVIVFGSQLSGVLAGALLAKRGYRVLHLDPEGLGTYYEDRGFELPYAPSVLPSLKRLPQADAALAELGIAIELGRILDGTGNDLQLLFPRSRLDLTSAAARRASEVGREFPDQKESLIAALEATIAIAGATDPFFKSPLLPLPPSGFFERFHLKKAIRAAPSLQSEPAHPMEGELLGEALRALGRFLIYLEDDEAGRTARARPVAQVLAGAHRFPGGAIGLREALRKRLGELGGDDAGVEGEPAVVEELLFEGRLFSGVKIAANKNVYRARCLVAGTDVAALAPLVPPRAKKRKLADLFESVRQRRYLFPINLVVRNEGLPLGLKELALIVPGDEELGPVLLEVAPARKDGRELPEMRVLCAAAFVSAAEHDASESRLRELAGRIEAATLEIAPFCEPHIVARSAPYLDAKNARGNRLSPHPLLEIGEDPLLGLSGLPQRTPCKNLFLASREVLPGLGLEGEFMAGLRATHLVQEMLRKHNPLK